MNPEVICPSYGACGSRDKSTKSSNHGLHHKIYPDRVHQPVSGTRELIDIVASDDGSTLYSCEYGKSKEIDGAQAWFTLALIFIMNATTLGSLKVYGLIYEEMVAQNNYTREEASWPISTATTVQNLAGNIYVNFIYLNLLRKFLS